MPADESISTPRSSLEETSSPETRTAIFLLLLSILHQTLICQIACVNVSACTVLSLGMYSEFSMTPSMSVCYDSRDSLRRRRTTLVKDKSFDHGSGMTKGGGVGAHL